MELKSHKNQTLNLFAGGLRKKHRMHFAMLRQNKKKGRAVMAMTLCLLHCVYVGLPCDHLASELAEWHPTSLLWRASIQKHAYAMPECGERFRA